jgi:hypothetical protein
MKCVSSVVRRFTTQELAVRRLYASDPEFKSLCEDYSIATDALERWKADEGKAEDYRQLIRELEDEINEYLER